MVGIRYLTIITGFQCFNYVHTCIWYNIRTYALTLLVIIYDRCHVINTRRYHPFSLSYLCYTWTLLVIISRPVPCMNYSRLPYNIHGLSWWLMSNFAWNLACFNRFCFIFYIVLKCVNFVTCFYQSSHIDNSVSLQYSIILQSLSNSSK